jgi:ubiquinone/menaquinone biosynthesis C-methylase UbiE
MGDSIKNWQKFGENDPYYGVLSDDRFRSKNLNKASLQEFFDTGRDFVKDSEKRLSEFFGGSLQGKKILDFGCGVGRLTLPFAEIGNHKTVGVDISEGVLEKARQHQLTLGLKNVHFHKYDGHILNLDEDFDFINSYIVFQHIEQAMGLNLLTQLLEGLKPGGIMQVHFTHGHCLPWSTYANFYLRTKVPLYNFFYSSLKHRRLVAEPTMQMNHYSIGKLYDLFREVSKDLYVIHTNHGGHLGAIYLLQKTTGI